MKPLYDDAEEEESTEEESGEDESSDLLGLAQQAFPDQEWDEGRLSAFKKLIAGCSGYMGDDEEPEEKKSEGASLLAFLSPKKKK
jgi:hypothetical protein